MLHRDVMDRSTPTVAFEVDQGVPLIGRAEFGTDSQPPDRPVRAGPNVHGGKPRRVPFVGRQGDRADVVVLVDQQVAMIARPQLDHVTRPHRRADILGHELALGRVRQFVPLLRFHQLGVEDFLDRPPGPARTAVACGLPFIGST